MMNSRFRPLAGIFTLLLLASLASGQNVTVIANSIDYASTASILDIYAKSGIELGRVDSSGFQQHKVDKVIFILGGHNAPEGVGDIVGTILTDQEKKQLVTDPIAKRIFVVKDLWVQGQVVFIFAGHGKEQTRAKLAEALTDIVRGLNFKDSEALDKIVAEKRVPIPAIDSSQPFTEVDADQANAIIDGVDDLIIMDVRGVPFYDAGRIPGAISMPQRKVDSDLQVFDREKTYLLYCGGNSESIYVGQVMDAMGFKNVYRLVDGYIAWRKAGYPAERTPR